ncbi:MAG TPA: hypothetical protein VL171_11810 [Verrucomicrobiae bacterium]|nr:hypothetical protein [Verrucomicrobiae bacterium]
MRINSLRCWRWTWVAFMVVATSVPYLVNYLLTPRGFHYTWIVPPFPQDSLGYQAWSEQAARGSLLFKIKYTAIPHSPFLFHPLFLACGLISSLLGCEIGVVHFFVKAVGVVLFFWVFFWYIDYLQLNRLQSIIATILVGVSSGCGWLTLKLGFVPDSIFSGPIDLNIPESNTFWSLLWNPLFPYSLALLVLSIFLVDRGTRQARNRDLWLSGFCIGLMALIHPYLVPLLLAVGILVIAIRHRRRATVYLLRFLAPTIPFALWTFAAVALNPVAAMHSLSGRMESPSPLSYVLGLGIPLLPTLGGLLGHGRKLISSYWQLLLWVAVSVVFTFLPFWFQRKFIFGIHVPLCILAAVVVDWSLARISGKRMRQWVLAGSAILLLPLLVSTQLFLFAAHRRIVRQNVDGVYYVGTDMLNALTFLKHDSNPDDIVFATYSTSQLIPAFSGNTVVWGHWAMSVDFDRRTEWVSNIFDPQSDCDPAKRSREFWGAGIKFILADGELKQWIGKMHPAWLTKGTDKVFQNTAVTIYRKRDNGKSLSSVPSAQVDKAARL